MNWTELNWTDLNWFELNWTELNCLTWFDSSTDSSTDSLIDWFICFDFNLTIYTHLTLLIIINVIFRAAAVSRQRIHVPTISSIQIQNRTFASDSKDDDSKRLPFGLEKILGETDNLIPTDLERKTDPGHIPAYAPPELKKDLQDLD